MQVNQTLSSYTTIQQKASVRDIRRVSVGFMLLVLSALGSLYNNILILRVADFAITIPLVLFITATLIVLFTPGQHRSSRAIVTMWLLLLLWQVISGLLLGLFLEIEWLRSESLFFVYTTCFMLTSRLQISRSYITQATNMVFGLILLFGFLGFVQFLLLNQFNINATLPYDWSVKPWNGLIDIHRTGGFQRAVVLSYEPSAYATGLVIGLTLLFFLDGIYKYIKTYLFVCSLLFLIAGITASFSVNGMSFGAVIVLIAILGGNKRLRGWIGFAIISMLIFVILSYIQGWFPVFTDRLHSIFEGNDNSANIRLLNTIRLIFMPTNDFADFIIGRGLGMDSNYRELIESVYGFSYTSSNIHNIFAIIKTTQGWMGLVLHLLLLLTILRWHSLKSQSPYLPLFAAIILLHFTSGWYLDPSFWAFLALVAVLRNDNWQADEKTPNNSIAEYDRKKRTIYAQS